MERLADECILLYRFKVNEIHIPTANAYLEIFVLLGLAPRLDEGVCGENIELQRVTALLKIGTNERSKGA